MKLRIWAVLWNPLTRQGPMATDIEYNPTQVVELREGLTILEKRSPLGKLHVFDASTGILLSNVSTEYVLREFLEFMERYGKDYPKELAKARSDLMKQKTDCRLIDTYEFWRLLHAA